MDGLSAGSIYALVALGYTLVYGVLRLINFAHSEVFMFGTFGAVYATRFLGIDPDDSTRPASRSSAVLLVCLAVRDGCGRAAPPCSSSASPTARSANEEPPDWRP